MRSAVLVLVVASACSPSRKPAPVEPPPAPPADAEAEPAVQRALTEGERAMLQPLFGASLDLDLVHVVQDKYVPFQGDDTYMTPENDIYAPGALYLSDFSPPMIEPYTASTLVHEATHAWQHQSGLDLVAAGAITFAATGGDYQAAYPYTLDRDKDLLDYNVEQQASIVEDWWLLTQRQTVPYSLILDPTVPPDWTAVADAYRAVLADFFKAPAYARAIAPDELLRRHTAAIRGPSE